MVEAGRAQVFPGFRREKFAVQDHGPVGRDDNSLGGEPAAVQLSRG